MDITDQYPSTLDMPRIAGGQDPVLAVLEGARKRYKRGATPDQYLMKGGSVCALGAVAAAAGLTYKKWLSDDYASLSDTRSFAATLKRAGIEKETIDATKEAIKLLNKAARKLYLDSRDYKAAGAWSGPLEWINQEFSCDFTESKKAVLACYDKAIVDRQAAVA